jgi:Cu-processing system permease protein
MLRQIRTLAIYVIQEALLTRFFVVILILLLLGFGLTIFLGQVAIIERQSIQCSLLAAFLRLSAVYVVSLFVITSMVREFNGHMLFLWLSLPLRRSTYFLGKLVGFTLVFSSVALTFSLALLVYTSYEQVILWGLSLWCELLIVTCVSLLCVLTLHQMLQAFSAVVGFYIVARSIEAIQLMAQSPLNSSDLWQDKLLNKLIQLLSMLLPDLERFTQTGWLVYHSGDFNDLLMIVGQTAIYVLLLIMMSLFDLYRKNL